MDISIPLIRLAFLALPGLLASKFYRKLRGRTVKKNWEDFFEILIFSLLSYLILALFVSLGQGNPNNDTSQASIDPNSPEETLTIFDIISGNNADNFSIDFTEIAWASLIGLLLAVCASYIHTYKIPTFLCRFIRATYRVADEDIWSLFHEGKSSITWLFVRDHKLNLIYYGCITYFSDSDKEREMIIEDVTVFNENGDRLYETPSIYISRDKYDFTIELVGDDATIKQDVENDNNNNGKCIKDKQNG